MRTASGAPEETEKKGADQEALGAPHVGETVAHGKETQPEDRDVGAGHDAVSGVPRDDPPSVGAGERLPARDDEQIVSDALLSDDGDHGEDAVPEWEIFSAYECGEVLEPRDAASQSPHVTRAQADRIVTLISQGWDPDTIFERVGVAII